MTKFLKIKAKFTILILVTSLLPGLVVSDAQAQNARVESSASLPAVSVTFSQLFIQSKVTMINQAACIFGQNLTTNRNFVQDQQLINLNEPANCFGLGFGQISVQERLAVTTLPTAKVQVVETKPLSLNSSRMQNSTSEGNVPILPLASSAALIIVIVIVGTFSAKTFRNQKLHFRQSLSLSQLQIMRC